MDMISGRVQPSDGLEIRAVADGELLPWINWYALVVRTDPCRYIIHSSTDESRDSQGRG